MELIVAPESFALFPGLRLAVAVAHGVDNGTERPAVSEGWRAAWRAAGDVGAAYGNAQSHPLVAPWRAGFRRMGVSGREFPSSIEALLRRALKGGEPFSINPLVDFYNTVSLRHTAPAGAFDLADVEEAIELRLTRAGDVFTALDAAEPLELPPGELAYVTGHTVLTRHFVWRQAREGLVTPATRSVVLLSEVLAELGSEAAARVRDEFVSGLRDDFGVEARGFILDASNPRAAW